MTVVPMYPRIKCIGPFDPKFANLVDPTSEPYLKPRSVYIHSMDGGYYVFKKTDTGKIRRGHYKSLIDAVYAAHCKR